MFKVFHDKHQYYYAQGTANHVTICLEFLHSIISIKWSSNPVFLNQWAAALWWPAELFWWAARLLSFYKNQARRQIFH
jgi:hypothetical protein